MIRLRCVEKLLGDDYKRNHHLRKPLTQAAAKRGKARQTGASHGIPVHVFADEKGCLQQ
jgi:hypothetical protein